MKVKAGEAHLLDHIHPARTGVEATTPQRAALGTGEEQRTPIVLHVSSKVLAQRGGTIRLRDADHPPAALDFGRTDVLTVPSAAPLARSAPSRRSAFPDGSTAAIPAPSAAI